MVIFAKMTGVCPIEFSSSKLLRVYANKHNLIRAIYIRMTNLKHSVISLKML